MERQNEEFLKQHFVAQTNPMESNNTIKNNNIPSNMAKSKVPLLNLNTGLKGINSQENNLPQKNINMSDINNESLEKNEQSESGSFNRTILVKQIDYNPDEKSKYSIKMPDNKGKSPQNLSFVNKKNAIIEEPNQIQKNDMTSPNFQKKIAGKVFMPKLNLKGDNRIETSKIGETPFDIKSMIINAEKKQKNER